MTIQLFVPTFHVDECLAQIRECLEKGWTGLGFKTVELETAWKNYTGAAHAHFLASNTVGLHLACEVLKKRLGWQDGDEVISTPLTFIASNHAILHAGLKPVFADVDDYLCLDPESVKARITPRTRAVMFVGLGGNVGQYQKIVDLCREYKLALILDAAHMSGTYMDGKHVGDGADATVYSFQAVKNLPTGDSGMVCFAKAEDDAKARKLSWLGINKDTFSRTSAQGAYKWMYDVEDVGYKYNGNSIMASIALVQLRYLNDDNDYRRQLAAWYAEEFAGAANVRMVPHAPECKSSRHLFQIRIANREEVMTALASKEIYAGVHYRDNTEYRMYAYGHGTCPQAEKASQEILSLPMHMHVTREDVALVAATVKVAAKQGALA